MSEQYTQTGDSFAALYPYEFIVLTTFRRNGQAMPTTIWFTHDNGKLYFTTSTTTGKIKRIRNDSQVFVAPSDRVGNVLGEKVAGQAREVTSAEHEHVQNLLRAKYGAQFDEVLNSSRLAASTRTYGEIAPVQS